MVLPSTTGFWESFQDLPEQRSDWNNDSPTEELVALLKHSLLPVNASCLDMHCGNGCESVFLAGNGFQVTGIDPSKKALELAAERAGEQNFNIRWLCRSAENTQLPDHSFDFINDRQCFQHLLRTHRNQYVSEMIRLLRPGGWMLVRNCKISPDGEHREVTQDNLGIYFPEHLFSYGPAISFSIRGEKQEHESHVILIRKK